MSQMKINPYECDPSGFYPDLDRHSRDKGSAKSTPDKAKLTDEASSSHNIPEKLPEGYISGNLGATRLDHTSIDSVLPAHIAQLKAQSRHRMESNNQVELPNMANGNLVEPNHDILIPEHKGHSTGRIKRTNPLDDKNGSANPDLQKSGRKPDIDLMVGARNTRQGTHGRVSTKNTNYRNRKHNKERTFSTSTDSDSQEITSDKEPTWKELPSKVKSPRKEARKHVLGHSGLRNSFRNHRPSSSQQSSKRSSIKKDKIKGIKNVESQQKSYDNDGYVHENRNNLDHNQTIKDDVKERNTSVNAARIKSQGSQTMLHRSRTKSHKSNDSRNISHPNSCKTFDSRSSTLTNPHQGFPEENGNFGSSHNKIADQSMKNQSSISPKHKPGSIALLTKAHILEAGNTLVINTDEQSIEASEEPVYSNINLLNQMPYGYQKPSKTKTLLPKTNGRTTPTLPITKIVKKASELHMSPHQYEHVQNILELPKRQNRQDMNPRKETPGKNQDTSLVHGGNVLIRNSGKVHTSKIEINNKLMSIDHKDESNHDEPHGINPYYSVKRRRNDSKNLNIFHQKNNGSTTGQDSTDSQYQQNNNNNNVDQIPVQNNMLLCNNADKQVLENRISPQQLVVSGKECHNEELVGKTSDNAVSYSDVRNTHNTDTVEIMDSEYDNKLRVFANNGLKSKVNNGKQGEVWNENSSESLYNGNNYSFDHEALIEQDQYGNTILKSPYEDTNAIHKHNLNLKQNTGDNASIELNTDFNSSLRSDTSKMGGYLNRNSHNNIADPGTITLDMSNSSKEGNSGLFLVHNKEEQQEDENESLDTSEIEIRPQTCRARAWNILDVLLKFVGLFASLYFFICSLDLLSSAFTLLGGRSAGNAFQSPLLQNPVCGLMIGVVCTALLQSSSTSTSIVVTMVAANLLTVEMAIPIIMGANIGTSVTGILVAVTQAAGDGDTFMRAFAAATVHDMFNWLSVAILLPLEVMTGYLYHISTAIVASTDLAGGTDEKQFLSVLTDPLTELIIQLDKSVLDDIARGDPSAANRSMLLYWCEYESRPVDVASTHHPDSTVLPPTTMVGIVECRYLFHGTSLSEAAVGGILLLISLTMLIGCLILMVKILKSLLEGKLASVIQKTINSNFPGKLAFLTGYVAILVGAVVTVLVQSSSVVSATLTPLAGVGMVTLDRVFPLMLGANIGTTSTAILAAFAATGDRVVPAFQIAMCHLFFNLTGILIWYPIPHTRRVPLRMATFLGSTTARYRWFAFVYLLVMFFLLPMFVFVLSLPGWWLLATVAVPIIILAIVIGVINLLQSKKPGCLPEKLRTWEFVPLWMRSLEPMDSKMNQLIRKCNCCGCCDNVLNPQDEQQDSVAESKTETSNSETQNNKSDSETKNHNCTQNGDILKNSSGQDKRKKLKVQSGVNSEYFIQQNRIQTKKLGNIYASRVSLDSVVEAGGQDTCKTGWVTSEKSQAVPRKVMAHYHESCV